jgi:glutaminyl-peptide cyclotransferase
MFEEALFVIYRVRSIVLLVATLLLGPLAVTAQEASPVAAIAPTFGYRVVTEYPHDRRAFTQGLAYVDGVLYEGTGLYGESTLRRVDLETGEVQQAVRLSEEYFGEGIAVLGDRIYQLTWKNGVCVVVDRETFELQDAFTYQTEGWGLTTDGERLIMSDGTNRLFIRDPETFAELDTIDVYDGARAIWNLNELEVVDDEIWANVWQTDLIARIDPETGQVTGWIDLTGLLSEKGRQRHSVDVLNGIALDPETDRLFVTGKLWPKLFEIEVVPR